MVCLGILDSRAPPHFCTSNGRFNVGGTQYGVTHAGPSVACGSDSTQLPTSVLVPNNLGNTYLRYSALRVVSLTAISFIVTIEFRESFPGWDLSRTIGGDKHYVK